MRSTSYFLVLWGTFGHFEVHLGTSNLTYCAINPVEDAFHLSASLFLLISEFLRTSKKIAAEKHQIIPTVVVDGTELGFGCNITALRKTWNKITSVCPPSALAQSLDLWPCGRWVAVCGANISNCPATQAMLKIWVGWLNFVWVPQVVDERQKAQSRREI